MVADFPVYAANSPVIAEVPLFCRPKTKVAFLFGFLILFKRLSLTPRLYILLGNLKIKIREKNSGAVKRPGIFQIDRSDSSAVDFLYTKFSKGKYNFKIAQPPVIGNGDS
tara:strand:- start:201 stop:530 length:330 start_codon:yes stop_codon:yes gene_type:complete